LKNRIPHHPIEGQDRELSKITAFFLGLAMIPGVGRFFNNLLGVLFGCCREKLEFCGEFLARPEKQIPFYTNPGKLTVLYNTKAQCLEKILNKYFLSRPPHICYAIN
jgi:hypothetical protein